MEDYISTLEKLDIRIRYRLSDGQVMCECPFHKDKGPSFCYHPEKKVFNCFQCGQGGSLRQLALLVGNEELARPTLDIDAARGYKQAEWTRKLCLSLGVSAANNARSGPPERAERVWDEIDRMMAFMPTAEEGNEALSEYKKALYAKLEAVQKKPGK